MKKTPTYKITLWPYGLESGGPDAMIGYSTDYGKYFEIHLQWGKAGLLPYADVCVITSVYIYIYRIRMPFESASIAVRSQAGHLSNITKSS